MVERNKSAVSEVTAQTAISFKSEAEKGTTNTQDDRYFGSFQNAPPEEDEDDFFRFKLNAGMAQALRPGGTTSHKDHGEVIMDEDWRQFHLSQEVMRIMVCARSFEAQGPSDKTIRSEDLKSIAQDLDDKTLRSMKSMYEDDKTVLSAVELSKYQDVVNTAVADKNTKEDPKRAAATELLKQAMEGTQKITATQLAEALSALADDVEIDKGTMAPMFIFMTEQGILTPTAIEKITAEIQVMVKEKPKLLMNDLVPLILKYADTEKMK